MVPFSDRGVSMTITTQPLSHTIYNSGEMKQSISVESFQTDLEIHNLILKIINCKDASKHFFLDSEANSLD